MVFWALAVSKVPNATSNTKAIKAMGLKGVFTDSSSESGSYRTGFSNLDAITYNEVLSQTALKPASCE
jgi:hypothetical protein